MEALRSVLPMPLFTLRSPSDSLTSNRSAGPAIGSPLERSVVDPEALDDVGRQALIDELYAAHAQIFDGVSKAAFAAYVVDSPAQRTRIEIYRARGRVVGYQAVHTFVRTVAGQRWVVVRAEMGKLPAYRRDANGRLMIAEVLRACLRYPGARKAFLGCLVHPSAYLALARVAPEIYPRPEAPTPAPIARVMAELAASFGLERVEEAGEHDRREVGWITRESLADRRAWAARADAEARFYLRANPGYREGQGLVTFVPISPRAFVEGSARHVIRSSHRRLQRVRVRAGLGRALSA